MTDEPPGEAPPTVDRVVARNVRRIREGQNLTYSEVVRRLDSTGHPMPILALRRIEKGERRVTVGDLLAICYALDVMPVDLLVPNDLDDLDDYAIGSDRIAVAANVRDWICGQSSLGVRAADGSPVPQTDAWGKPANVLRWRSGKFAEWILSVSNADKLPPAETQEGDK